jgi:hypothetical protein
LAGEAAAEALESATVAAQVATPARILIVVVGLIVAPSRSSFPEPYLAPR